mmetsp:Transcript_13764/g.39636  ORF Transcript_13764/g.39636 Transcript_13764/m.39636 type:complete len:320 (-) Transcript_13764:61-1020(-)
MSHGVQVAAALRPAAGWRPWAPMLALLVAWTPLGLAVSAAGEASRLRHMGAASVARDVAGHSAASAAPPVPNARRPLPLNRRPPLPGAASGLVGHHRGKLDLDAVVGGDLAVARPPTAALAMQSFREFRSSALTAPAPGDPPRSAKGGTACMCVCGDRVVWNRLVFEGDVEKMKEDECEHQVCPQIIIPGLQVRSECFYVQDLSELQAGTVCQCQCGDKLAWRDRPFYGNVTEERERYCMEDLCPRINPLPGVRFEASCTFNRYLFAQPRTYPAGMPQIPAPTRPPGTLARSAVAAMRPSGVLAMSVVVLSGLMACALA